ncbi:reverse transcriptase domain-containing protein [Tanacetum coccineum]
MVERTMEELLHAPTEGYGEAIVLPEINADHFEIKTNLLQLVQASPFHGYKRENPHAHINSFKRITSTLRFRDVPNDVIKLMMFPYSLEGAAKVWYEKEPPNSILTWEDLERETEETRDNEQTNFQGSTTHIPPPVNPIMILEPDVLKTLPMPNIPISKDVYVKVGKFHFPTDFVVVDFVADPRVPLILGRSFLRTGRTLVDVYGEEITLRVDNEAITFNLDQTTRYSSTNEKSVNRIDIIVEVCEEYAPEVLGFSNKSSGGNPNPTSEPLTSEFILEEIEAYLKDDLISPEIDHADCDPEGDICLIEKLLNNDPFQLPPMDLKQGEVIKEKSSIEEPPELELKDLPSHLEYAYLEGNDKLPVIIAKGLKDVEKEALLKVLKSHKRAIAWKITDIKGLVTRWRVCIEYRKLNEATRKDHFPLPFMDQMLERLAGNEFYCFLDGFSGYFQIPIDPQDQEKTTFTCPYRTFAYRRMPFGLCNAPDTFQRCMMAIFHDIIKKTIEVFMDDFSVFVDSFDSCLSNLEKMLKRCEDTNLVLN